MSHLRPGNELVHCTLYSEINVHFLRKHIVSETEESFLEFLYRLADPILRTEYTDVIMPMYFIWEDFFVIVMPCYALLACSY